MFNLEHNSEQVITVEIRLFNYFENCFYLKAGENTFCIIKSLFNVISLVFNGSGFPLEVAGNSDEKNEELNIYDKTLLIKTSLC